MIRAPLKLHDTSGKTEPGLTFELYFLKAATGLLMDDTQLYKSKALLLLGVNTLWIKVIYLINVTCLL